MRRFILTVATLALLLPATPVDAQMRANGSAANEARRTLVARVGQETLHFEAPIGMCFVDPTKQGEREFYASVKDFFTRKADETLLGVFAPCQGLANMGGGGVNNPEGQVMSTGLILWPQRSVGDTLDLDLAGYLDLRAASFEEYLGLTIDAWSAASNVSLDPSLVIGSIEQLGPLERSDHAITSVFAQELRAGGEKHPLHLVASTTLLRGYPIEVALRLGRFAKDMNKDQAHEFAQKFMAQQVALNR